jgi:uncharacterized membrane protein YesL
MGKLFDLDSPLMRFLTRVADVMWLNILTLLFAIPLILEQIFFLSPVYYALMDSETPFELQSYLGVILFAWIGGIICSIPLGAATTAMHYVLLKIVRDEDSYITKSFFKSFKENFKQATVLQMIQFFVAGVLLFDFIITKDMNGVYMYIVLAFAIILYMASLYIYPLLSKFNNTIWGTIKNAFLMSVLALPKTVLMVVVTGIPVLILYFFDLKAVPFLLLVGIAGPGYLLARLYTDTFKRFEPKEEELSEEEELDAAIRKIDEVSAENVETADAAEENAENN